jgi:Ca2+-binding EF-hand superfamily protein
MTVRAFQMHDADGDTQVTEDELAAMAAIMQSHMNVRQVERQGMMGNG